MEARAEEVHAHVRRRSDEADRAALGALADEDALRLALALDRLGDEVLAKRAPDDVRLRLEDGDEVVVVLDAARAHVHRREDGLAGQEEQLGDGAEGGRRDGGEEGREGGREGGGAAREDEVVDLRQRLEGAPEQGLHAEQLRVRVRRHRRKEDDAGTVRILQGEGRARQTVSARGSPFFIPTGTFTHREARLLERVVYRAGQRGQAPLDAWWKVAEHEEVRHDAVVVLHEDADRRILDEGFDFRACVATEGRRRPTPGCRDDPLAVVKRCDAHLARHRAYEDKCSAGERLGLYR